MSLRVPLNLLVFSLVMMAALLNAEPISDLKGAWQKHKVDHKLEFGSTLDESTKLSHFKKTHHMITKHNSNPNATFKMEHNKFSSMSPSEREKYFGYKPSANRLFTNATTRFNVESRAVLPASVDHRSDPCMQPVKDQGACGSCWAFAAVAPVEFNNCAQNGKKVALSEQQLTSCAVANGCDGYGGPAAIIWLAHQGGLNTQSSYRYTSGSNGVSGACQYKSENNRAAVLASVPYVTQIQPGDVNTMMHYLANRRLIMVGICATDSFASYRSGIYTNPGCPLSRNHAVVIVGYGRANGLDYWIVRNSWGSGWGQRGYILFQKGVNLCSIEDDAAALTVSNLGAFSWITSTNKNYTWAPNCAYTGGTFQWLSLTSTEACGTACASNSKCTHFIYHSSLQICDLLALGTNPNPVTDGIRSCGRSNYGKNAIMFKDDVSYQFVTGNRCNYPLNDISVLTLNSVTECGNACNGSPKCNHFIYNPSLKLCNLKWANIGKSPIGDRVRQCGYIKDRFWVDSGKYVSRAHCDYPGNDLVTKTFNSLDECINACIDDAQCTHFGYGHEAYGGDCMFKKAGSNPIINYDAYRTCGYIKP